MERTASLVPGQMRPAAPSHNHASLRYYKHRTDPPKRRPTPNRRPTQQTHQQQQQRQRLSAHKVSLFRYDHVSAMSSTRAPRSAAQAKSPLLPAGPLELYQIVTPAPNLRGKAQEMNYLSLGRQGNIVHPILPRLQVTRLSAGGDSFLIAFYNPERYWELQFLPGPRDDDVGAAVSEFERVISGMCVYTAAAAAAAAAVEDDLDYLLLTDDDDDDDAVAESRRPVSDDAINEAFKRAIQLVMPPLAAQRHPTRRRFSSYVPVACPQPSAEPSLSNRMSLHLGDYRRIFSGPPYIP